MFLSVEQHLGYYHQSGPALQKWVIWCNVSNCAKGFRCRQLWIKISFTFFIRINILTFSLFSTSLSLSFSFFWQANCMPLLFISLHFRGTNCSPLSLGSGQEFIFSGSNVSECHFWQEPTSTMNTREDTACWVFFLSRSLHTLTAWQPCTTQSTGTNCLCRNQYWIKTLPTHE